ncbi:CDP-glucose 4,6-dehydratase [Pelagibacterales bacterium SAG-MED39]|nr:CDP-glucose 4,6-dehydratase [Pelagibacterales bacterium SAG-MED39]
MEFKKLKKFYKNKKVLVTGNTGFKGIWLFLILKFLGAKVKGFSLPLYKNDSFIFFKILKKNLNKETVYGDVLDYNKLFKTIKLFKPQIIFHFAAQSLVIESQKKPKKTLETNLIGTNNIIKICFKIKSIKSLIVATSDKCYLNKGKKKPFKENSELGGVEVYSSSKAMCEQLINLYLLNNAKINSFGLSSIRAGNVIGGGDFGNYRIIPDIIKKFKSKRLTLRNPKHIRPWQHVLDVCYAYLLVPVFHYKDKKKYSGPYNVGPSNKNFVNVLNLTKKFISMLGKNYEINFKKNIFTESKLLLLDSKKIYNLLRWSPHYGIETSIKKTASWYKNYLNKNDIKKFTELQIKHYFDDQ